MGQLKVQLSDLMEGIEFQSDDMQVYLNTKTGEVVYVSDEDKRAVNDDLENYPEWQWDSIKAAEEVIYEDYFEFFPSKYDINEYQMMEIFSESIEDGKIKKALLKAINGRGAFRKFKDEIFEQGVRVEWYDYRDQCLKVKIIISIM